MPDLVTHLCSVLLPKAFFGGRHTGVLAIGVCLPDVASRLPGLALQALDVRLGVPVPRWLVSPWSALHLPIGAGLVAVLSCLFFEEAERKVVLGWLVAGVALHLLLDVAQDHHGQGYALLFPCSDRLFELGWIGSEATVPWAPWLALATAAAWVFRSLYDRRRR